MSKILKNSIVCILATILTSCGGNDLVFHPSPTIQGSFAEYYNVKDVTVTIVKDKNHTDFFTGKPYYEVTAVFTIVRNENPGLESEWAIYDKVTNINVCSMYLPSSIEQFSWGIGLTIEDDYHNDIITLRDGETPGGGKLLEYCIKPGQEYKYIWNEHLSSSGFDESEYKVMDRLYDGEFEPYFRLDIGKNVWLGKQK